MADSKENYQSDLWSDTVKSNQTQKTLQSHSYQSTGELVQQSPHPTV